MTLVLTSPTNPGTSEWTDASDLPAPATPYEVISLTGQTYTIADGSNRFFLFTLDAPGSTVVLPSAAANAGITLTMTGLGMHTATINGNGSDSLGPYGVGSFSINGAGSPRLLQLVSVPAATQTGQNYWMLVSSV